MTHRELEDILQRSTPFTLNVADGRFFEVPHRDYVFLPPRSTTVTLALPDREEPEFLRYHVIPLLMVSGVSYSEPALPES
jgi:hypothetical protein